ncbi:hypothetical protein M440DRAFT_1139144 [Trichoderma longibrachiatum ATCC 18648]|uniref:Uncharacterized protein n=1 Tax=Trichoderma longibrachiatum ATCC 18648 TaxID=983965 RepID=A0A2T4BQT4_TRILO|nr:hypothetical protein M440DRAFT_1139144 [Trichoderma longibrachiatum ATCC 18648]
MLMLLCRGSGHGAERISPDGLDWTGPDWSGLDSREKRRNLIQNLAVQSCRYHNVGEEPLSRPASRWRQCIFGQQLRRSRPVTRRCEWRDNICPGVTFGPSFADARHSYVRPVLRFPGETQGSDERILHDHNIPSVPGSLLGFPCPLSWSGRR